MPFKKRIADVERLIDETLAQISILRKKRADKNRLEQCLAMLARLKAQRLRLMERQDTFDRNSN